MTLAVRDTGAGERTAADITATTGNPAVHVGRLDLADQVSVAAFVADWSGPLHVLINNAGVMAVPELQLTPEGWEMQFATNHLGHLALALGLHDALAAAGDARIVSLSSAAHLEFAGDLRRPELHLPPVRSGARLRAVQDRQRPLRGRGDPPLGRRRHHRERRPPGRDRGHQPARHMDPRYWRTSSPRARTRSRHPSRAPRRASWSRPRPSSRASAAATSRTATRRPSATPGSAASRPTRSTPAMPGGSGRCRCACSTPRCGRPSGSRSRGPAPPGGARRRSLTASSPRGS